MAYSRVEYPGNGTQTNFTFSFPYLSQSHVIVQVDGVETEFTWINASTVKISPAPASGTVVEIFRQTERDERLVDFTNGAIVNEDSLDTSALQNFYLVQESLDAFESSLGGTSSSAWDARDRRIINVANPAAAQDAATRDWVEWYTDTLTLNTWSGRVDTIADLEELGGASVAVVVQGRDSVGDGAGGVFVWTEGDQSDSVSADPEQGVWVAPSGAASGTSGAWRRHFSGPVDVRWFGAKGDGSTDDTSSVQAAIDYVSDQDGGTVWFPAGAYSVSDTLEVESDYVRLLGEGGAKIVQGSDYGDVIYVHGNGANPVKFVAIDRLTIENIATVTSGAAIRIEGCVRSWFKNLYIHNTFKGITLSAVGACWFTDIYMLADDAMAYTGRSQFETNRFAAGTYPNDGVANVFLSGVQCTSPPSGDRRIENSLYIKESDGIWISNSYFGWALNNITYETTAATVLFNYVFLSNVMSDGGGTNGAGYNIRFLSTGGSKTIAKCGFNNVNCEGGALIARGCYIKSGAKVHGLTFNNCLFSGAYAEGFIIESGASASYVELSNCTARANGARSGGTSPGIAILDGDHITITGGSSGGQHTSSVATQSYGIVTSADATNVRITGVNLENNATAPISAAPAHVVTGCAGGEDSTVASAAIIPPPLLTDVAYVTGTSDIENITPAYNGRRITLVFASGAAVKMVDGGNLKLASDFNADTNDSLSLIYSSDANAWIETCRSVN